MEKENVSQEQEQEQEENPQPLMDLTKLTDFLKTEEGQQTLDKLIGFINGRSEKGGKLGVWQYGMKMAVALVAVGGGIWLSYHDKFDASIAVLLGSVIGYLLGGRRYD